MLSMGIISAGAKLEGDKVVLPDLELKAPKVEVKTEPVKMDTKKEGTKKEVKKQ